MAKYIYMYLNYCYIPKCKWGAARLCLCRFFIIYRLYVIYAWQSEQKLTGHRELHLLPPLEVHFTHSVGSRKTSNDDRPVVLRPSTWIFFSFWFGSDGVCSLRTLPLCTVLTTSGTAQTMEILLNPQENGLLFWSRGHNQNIAFIPRNICASANWVWGENRRPPPPPHHVWCDVCIF